MFAYTFKLVYKDESSTESLHYVAEFNSILCLIIFLNIIDEKTMHTTYFFWPYLSLELVTALVLCNSISFEKKNMLIDLL